MLFKYIKEQYCDKGNNMDLRKEWSIAREELIYAMKQLGSPKAIRRMTAYLYNAKPHSEEIVVDEMLAICSEIEAWRERRAAREANEAYNELLFYGFDDEE